MAEQFNTDGPRNRRQFGRSVASTDHDRNGRRNFDGDDQARPLKCVWSTQSEGRHLAIESDQDQMTSRRN